MTDLIQEIEKAIDEYAHDKIEAAGIKAGAQFILPLLKKAIEQRDAQMHWSPGYDMAEHDNKELLKLLGEKHE